MASLKAVGQGNVAIKDNPGLTTMPKTERDWTKFIQELSDIVDGIETDVPPSGNFMTLDTTQTATGLKTFTKNPFFNDNPLWNNVNVGTQINSLPHDTAPDPAVDYMVVYDASDDAPKKINMSDLIVTSAEVNDLTVAVTWANVPDANITESSVTQHEAALSITQSQVSDVTATAAELNLLDLSGLTTGWVLSADSPTTASWKAQAVAAEVNDLTAAVTWANVPDANITASSVTQHEAALTILETQITDGALLARNADNETITGDWTFDEAKITLNNDTVTNYKFMQMNVAHATNDNRMNWQQNNTGGAWFFRPTVAGVDQTADDFLYNFTTGWHFDSTLVIGGVLTVNSNIVATGSSTAADFNGVALTTAGAATNYLDETGNYSVPPGSGGGGSLDDELLHYWFS
jgi:hypothetical protein